MPAELLKLPTTDIGDIPIGLRALADRIEKEGLGDRTLLAWILEPEEGGLQIGMLGRSSEPGAVTYLMLGAAMRKLEGLK